MTAYPYAERDKAYALISQTTDMADLVERIGRGEAERAPELQAALASMTGASDLHRQHKALVTLLDKVKRTHERRLVDAADKDFTAFVEVINPEEPCRSKLHRFLGEKLMEMEKTPGARAAISMPPGHAKDLCVETPVLMADGSTKRLGDIEIGDFVITHTGNSREVLAVHDQGVRDTIILKTMCGRKIRAHPEHPFLTPGGWIPAGELAKGDVLAHQREFAISNTSGRTIEEFALAGYMMAAGMVRGRAYSRMFTISSQFRTDDFVIMDDVLSIAGRLGYRAKIREGKTYRTRVRTAFFDETFEGWLRLQDLWGAKRYTMRVPDWVFKGSLREIGAFVGAVFACDARLVPVRNEQTGALRIIQMTSRNPGLAADMRALLSRLGCRAVMATNLYNNYNYEPTYFHTVTIPYDEDIAILKRSLRIVGQTERFWTAPVPVRHFFDGRYGEDRILDIVEAEPTETRCLEVHEDHSFLADGVVVHNSTYCSRLFTGWWLGKHEGKRWLQAGHTQRFAEKEFGKKLKTMVIDTDNYRKVFPDVAVRGQGSVDEINLTNNAQYVVKGVGQGISGYRSHFNNVDDPYATDKAAQSPTTRDTVWNWFANDFRSRRLPGAGELIIVTRWHTDDIVGRLEEKMEAGEIEPWDIINLPAFCINEELDPISRKLGDPLWPELFTESFLNDMKSSMSAESWESLYMGSPVLSKGNILNRDWIRYYTDAPIIKRKPVVGDPRNPYPAGVNPVFNLPSGDPRNPDPAGEDSEQKNPIYRLRTVVSVDSAETVSTRADYSAIQVWCLGSDYRHYLLDVIREKYTFPQLIEAIERAAKNYQADIILCETKGAGNQYIQARTGKAPCAIIPFKPGNVEKSMRFDGTMYLWESQQVWLPERAPWLLKYVDELLKFPSVKNDDNVDATSQYLMWAHTDGGWRRGMKKVRS